MFSLYLLERYNQRS